MARAKAKSFEEQLAELEQIVAELEAGTLDLDASLRRYQEGVALIRACRDKLTAAEQVLAEEQEETDHAECE